MRMSCAIYNTLENRLLASIEKHQDNNHTKSKIGKNPVSNFNESIPVTIKSEDSTLIIVQEIIQRTSSGKKLTSPLRKQCAKRHQLRHVQNWLVYSPTTFLCHLCQVTKAEQ